MPNFVRYLFCYDALGRLGKAVIFFSQKMITFSQQLVQKLIENFIAARLLSVIIA